MKVTANSRISDVHLRALRLAARSGHIRIAAMALAHLFPSADEALVIYERGGCLRIPMSDAYWARLLVGWQHEPEVDAMLRRALGHHADARLFDCGANIGYWAARYASRADLVLGIEPVPDTYARLQAAAVANGFLSLQAAVWSRSGELLRIAWDPAKHASASAVRGGGSRVTDATTVTIAELAARYGRGHPVVIKLDIEGAEPEAISGAESVLLDVLIIYEDHGQDASHRATTGAFNRGLVVTYFDGDSPRRVDGHAAVSEIKSKPDTGYNFVAHHPQGRWRDWLHE